jgi:hypothetical protein
MGGLLLTAHPNRRSIQRLWEVNDAHGISLRSGADRLSADSGALPDWLRAMSAKTHSD